MSEGIGKSVPRKEDNRFITGKGRYTDDIKQVGQYTRISCARPMHMLML